MFNSNFNFIMYAVYYRDPKDSYLFHLQSILPTLADAIDFYNIEYAGYIKNLTTDKVVYPTNL